MPKITLKTPEQIAIMAEGGKRLAQILEQALKQIEPGISTLEIDTWIDKGIAGAGGLASFKLVPGYRWASCVGLNDEVVHSIPKKDKIIRTGDLLKIDLGMLWQGYNSDLSWTVCIKGEGEKCDVRKEFLDAGKEALKEAIKAAQPGNCIGHISQKIQQVIEGAGYFPIKVLTGHGIGRKLHEDPLIPGFLKGKLSDSPKLWPGMSLAIEVIYGQTSSDVVMENDGWTISTKDGKMSGLFEKTIAVTENGPLILTKFEGN
ncbi:MAG: type I methionyl aminopeptidase [Patescibacteria group bacterium]|nr:type I methionyl aminopeptidase [Patescibacteria group bacterium]